MQSFMKLSVLFRYTTLSYRAPEMVNLYNGKIITTKADIWVSKYIKDITANQKIFWSHCLKLFESIFHQTNSKFAKSIAVSLLVILTSVDKVIPEEIIKCLQ